MFTWICPKCGGDVPPSMNECPRCSAQTSAAAPAAPVQTAPAAPPAQPSVTPPPPPVVPPAAVEPVPPPHSGTLFGQPAAAPAPPPPSYAPAPSYAPPAKAGLSPTLVAILATVGIAAVLAILFLWVIPSRKSAGEDAASKAPAPATAVQSKHPLAKHLEVMGVRIVDPGKGSARIQFVVVNHSAADLPELKMDVTLRAADKDFFTFPVNLPSIGPYESKELSTTVKTDLKPYELPDWQTIRPQFVLTSEP